MSLDELRQSLARVLGTELPVEEPRGRARTRCGVSTDRTPDRPNITGRAGSSWSAMRHMCTGDGWPRAEPRPAGRVNLGWKLAAVVNGARRLLCSTRTKLNVFPSGSE